MAYIRIAAPSPADALIAQRAGEFKKRIEATPPGMCPVAFEKSLLEASAAQSCGKCVPCRDGLPALASLLQRVVTYQATPDTLERIRTLAQTIQASADCAIGYEAATQVLNGLDQFAEEYRAHVQAKSCGAGVEQHVPCEALCPAHVNVPAYIALVAQGDYAGAIQMIRKDNPFPTACALVCEHPCEQRCRRGIIDAPLNIRGIKKFAVDNCTAEEAPVPARLPDTGCRVAVIGGGPSGLTCAYFLALQGHAVHVFEAHPQLGGMLRYGIPAYRLPRQRLDEDIRALLSVGNIEVTTNAQVDTAKMAELAKEYQAIYVAIGAQAGKKLDIEGAAAAGVVSAVDLLRAIGDGNYPDYSGKSVVVIGGGNVAMDCCRTAVRAGAKEVSCVYRRRLEDMTALPAEIESALAEGVEMLTLQAPVAIEANEAGNACAVLTQPQMISTVKGGRPAPVNAEAPRNRIPANVVLVAIGQDIESAPFEAFGMKANRGRFCANEFLQAGEGSGAAGVAGAARAAGAAGASAAGAAGIFVGGDCQTGPATAIKAIAAGKVAAHNIDEYLGFHHELDCGVNVPAALPNNITPCGRVNITERPARERKNDFEYVENPMTAQEAAQECGRCLRCDHYGWGSVLAQVSAPQSGATQATLLPASASQKGACHE